MSWEYDHPDGFEDWDEDRKCAWYHSQRTLKRAEKQKKVIEDHGRDWVEVMKEQNERIRAYLRASLMDGFDR